MIGVEVPLLAEFTVVEGGQLSESGNQKNAKINTGVYVQVPEFINEGDRIRVNTADGQYVDRAP